MLPCLSPFSPSHSAYYYYYYFCSLLCQHQKLNDVRENPQECEPTHISFSYGNQETSYGTESWREK